MSEEITASEEIAAALKGVVEAAEAAETVASQSFPEGRGESRSTLKLAMLQSVMLSPPPNRSASVMED